MALNPALQPSRLQLQWCTCSSSGAMCLARWPCAKVGGQAAACLGMLVAVSSLQGVVLAGLLLLCLPAMEAQVCHGASKHCRAHVGHQPGLARRILCRTEND